MGFLRIVHGPAIALAVMGWIGDIHAEEGKKMTIKVTSSAFKEGDMIPRKYTCQGPDVSPPLAFDSIPEGAKSLALICDDPDAPVGTWVHWVLFDLPGNTKELEEKVPPNKTLENGAVHGLNDFKKLGYGGPCPPSGTHRYFFKVHALDRKLGLPSGATKKDVEKAMEGHVLAMGQLMGKYKKS
ncbi:MAG: hypothetical protein GHCLOJNM_03943 [bacterium]|nr:hypothetical protein [bacterium]